MRAERRVALVVGNGAYSSSPLRNPPNDARDIAAALRAVGFTVIERFDVGRTEMQRAIIEFGSALDRGDVALFYYAGHGIQIDGKNYLVPIDAALEREQHVPVETVDIDEVLARMAGARNRLNIVVLDACRDNPFVRSFRSARRGLAQTLAPAGTFLAYATAPGDIAADGMGRNSPYTEALLTAMQLPGLEIEEVFKEARAQVRERTKERQIPWISSSVVGDFYFRLPATPVSPPPILKAAVSPEHITVWIAIKDSANPNDFRAFLDGYPESPLAPFARKRLETLEER